MLGDFGLTSCGTKPSPLRNKKNNGSILDDQFDGSFAFIGMEDNLQSATNKDRRI
jgi:hypothetical protein